MTSLRQEWFLYVAKTRKRMSRKSKEDVSHRDAMKEASTSWPNEKKKLLRKIKREQKVQSGKERPCKKPKAPNSFQEFLKDSSGFFQAGKFLKTFLRIFGGKKFDV